MLRSYRTSPDTSVAAEVILAVTFTAGASVAWLAEELTSVSNRKEVVKEATVNQDETAE